jgi:hypothetical protein
VVHPGPAHAQPSGQLGPLDRQVQVVGGHQVRIQPIRIQRTPAPIRPQGDVLDQHMRMGLGVAGAAAAMLEGHRQPPTVGLVTVDPVVLASHPDRMGLQVGDCGSQRGRAGRIHLLSAGRAAAGGQQTHTLGRGEAEVEGGHPGVDALTAVLPCRIERIPVQRPRVNLQHHAADPLCRLDLHPPGAAGAAGRLQCPHIARQGLGAGQLLQVDNASVGGVLAERRQERPGRQLGARVGPQQGLTALLAGGRVQAAEHCPDLLSGGDPDQAAGGCGLAQEAAW